MTSSMKLFALPIISFLLLALSQLGCGQAIAPSPVAEAPSSDGNTVDQGIAYVLMLVALAITYLIH
ncbi:hypothetical protein K2173_013239 [Erythroxylum novogranatense]|uniref:Uncharacterized protein n=1 Tax=Erythroxylum novogranatense TaxID=1862640 RepID=A0AAV8SCU1_9ROSI|nr:hypothetical protein K2173_013239 [Erythroxylum novogranatense]